MFDDQPYEVDLVRGVVACRQELVERLGGGSSVKAYEGADEQPKPLVLLLCPRDVLVSAGAGLDEHGLERIEIGRQ